MKIRVERPTFGWNYAPGYSAFTVRQKDFVAAGIQWFERWDALPDVPSPSHTFLLTGRDETIEAFGNGVHYGSLRAYLQDPNVALLVRRPKGWSPMMGEFLIGQAQVHLGEHYGYGLIAAHAVVNTYVGHLLTKLTGGWFERVVTRALDARQQEVCSELMARVLGAWPGFTGLEVVQHPATVKPVELFRDRELYEPPEQATELVDVVPKEEQ